MDLPPVLVSLLDGKLQKIRPVNMPDEFDTEMQSWNMAFKDLDQRRDRLISLHCQGG
jgi:hypothetical protein